MSNHVENIYSICIIGAGFSGLCAGIQLQTKLNLHSFTIFEQNSEVGGTWFSNVYPGCYCDVQSHLYCYSFEANPNWSSTYSPQSEILDYLQFVTNKYNLYKYIQFNTEVQALHFDEKLCQWRVNIYNKEHKTRNEFMFDLVINGSGFLRAPIIPEEFYSFNGEIFHSARWDPSVDLTNKTVGIVGNGSSAIQIIPKVANIAKEVHCFQRSAAWVMPQRQIKIPNFFKLLFYYVPFLLLIFRWIIFWSLDICHSAFIHKSIISKLAQWVGEKHLKSQVSDPELLKLLIPNYHIGCKRILVSNEYYKTMAQSHVKLHRERIVKVNSKGIQTTNSEFQTLDVIILCTGFDVHKYFFPISITSKNGQNILNLWTQNGPRGFLGITHSALPNYFSLLGPNTLLPHLSAIFMIECQVGYILQLLKEMGVRNTQMFELKPEAEDEYCSELEKQAAKTIWLNDLNTTSWYKVNNKLDAVWPWPAYKYWLKSRNVDFSMYKFRKQIVQLTRF